MNRHASLDRIFDEQLQTLAVSLRQSTIGYYRSAVNRFLRYLHTAYPKLHPASQLCRDPHILGWLRSLGQETPPLTNRSRRACLMCVRRLLDDLISNGQPLPEGLILRQDFPPPDLYLPQPLSPENHRRLDQQLCQTDDLHSNALLLLRATGMRIGECLRLQTDCLRHLSPPPDHDDQWALHVPLGKLHSERWVPADDRIRQIVARILALRGTVALTQPGSSSDWLLREPDGRRVSYQRMWPSLAEAARRAVCSAPVRPHQLRHTFATEMVRLGVSLPALKELLGHRDIRMTMVYVKVTQGSAAGVSPGTPSPLPAPFHARDADPSTANPRHQPQPSVGPQILGSHSPSPGNVSPSTGERKGPAQTRSFGQSPRQDRGRT